MKETPAPLKAKSVIRILGRIALWFFACIGFLLVLIGIIRFISAHTG